jgi:transposase InsO family protein
MTMQKSISRIPFPKSWPNCVRSGMLHVISLAQYAMAYTRSWAAESSNARVRQKARADHAEQDAALVREEMRIKDGRMAGIAPQRRPYYSPAARLEILQVRAARNWSLQQTADAFLVTAATIASWMNRLNEDGPDALVKLREPVNKFPKFVRLAVQRLKVLCPSMGKKKLAEVLARAGLHLGTTTIGRIRAKPPKPSLPSPLAGEGSGMRGPRVVTAKRLNHVWHVDLITVPTQMGMWCPWLPFALGQCLPFCWWLALVQDHHSRRIMGFAVFRRPPASLEMRAFLGRVIHANSLRPLARGGRGGRAPGSAAPKYIISDKGSQFWPCAGFKRWCKRRNIRPRFGAIGQHGSIAVIERLIKTIKREGLAGVLIPFRREVMQQLMTSLVGWYNEHRPHTTLKGATPNEVYFKRFPANRKPRIEPRSKWPRGSPCALPNALVGGNPGARFDMEVEHVGGHSQLPIIRLRRAA